uniref:Uncharacterized protein n=1 Tax=Leersia perrieri TaxID=77586 RepID=A0A0D9WCK9_9ORYZ
MLISGFYSRIRHGDWWVVWRTWIELAHERAAVVQWALTVGLVAVLFWQNWKSISEGASIWRKPSSVFYWAGSGYAFGCRNPLEGAVKVPAFSFT